MASLRTITSANSVFSLAVLNLFPTPQKVQGYSADTAFTLDAVASAEVHMGVDGKLSAGYTPQPRKLKVKLQADSDSVDIFDQWHQAQQAIKELYACNATIDVPALGKSYTLTKGFLSNYKPMPDAKKVLEPVEFEITFELVTYAPLNN